MMDLLGVIDGTSATHSPWSCKVVGRHHTVVDSTYETLLQWAVFVKNSNTSSTERPQKSLTGSGKSRGDFKSGISDSYDGNGYER